MGGNTPGSTPKAPPAVKAVQANQASVLAQGARDGAEANEESFAFSVVRKTVMNLLSPLIYGTVGVSFFGLTIGGMAKSGVGALEKLAKTIVDHSPVGGAATSATPIVEMADSLLLTGAVFGGVALTASLLSNVISTHMECENARRAKCQKAQAPAAEKAPQIVVVPVAVDVTQNAHARQEIEANPQANAKSTSTAMTDESPEALASKFAQMIELQRAQQSQRERA